MKRFPKLIVFLLVTLGIQAAVIGGFSFVVAGGQQITYLGQGGTHTIEEGKNFIVKRLRPFRFETVPGPTYTATDEERVWSTNGGAPQARDEEWIDIGQVGPGCEISFQAIDDDEDGRINKFYVGDEEVYTMPQGMVTSGGFTVEDSGNLRLYAEDSIGLWVNECENPPTVTPTDEPPVTETPTASATSTTPPDATGTLTGTLTATPPPGETPSPTPTGDGTPQPTPTDSPPQPTNTPTVEPTATKKPRLPSCSRINFEVAGQSARAGRYDVYEIWGRHLYTWYAEEGWQDSGWYQPIDITFENVLVEVIYQNPGGQPITLVNVNPAPNTTYGWMSRGMCHALEVAWPDTSPTISPQSPGQAQATPPAAPPSAEQNQPDAAPDPEPTAEPPPSGGTSLRG